MGFKLQLGIAAAIIIGIIAFRDQIKAALVGAGTTLGEGVGGGFGGFLTGLGTGFAEPVQAAIGPVKPGFTSEFFFSGPLGQALTGGITPPAFGQMADPETVTPQNRERSDVPIVVRSQTLGKTFEFKNLAPQKFIDIGQPLTKVFESALAQPSTVGHAQRVREIASQAGLPTPKVIFEATRQAALREGRTPAQALQLAKQAINR